MNDETRPQRPPQEAPVLPRQRQKTWLPMLLGAAILLCGIAIGAGATMLWVRARVQRSGDEDIRVEQLAKHIQRRCGLSDEQTLRVADVFRMRLHALQEIGEEILPRVQAEHELLCDELRAILTPEQFEKWNRDFAVMRRRRLGFRRGRMRRNRQPSESLRQGLPTLRQERQREAHED